MGRNKNKCITSCPCIIIDCHYRTFNEVSRQYQPVCASSSCRFVDSLLPDSVYHDGAPNALREILMAPLIHWSELAEAEDGLDGLEQRRNAGFESREALPYLNGPWECYMVGR